MTGKRQRPGGPTGLEALGAIGARLGEILGAVENSLKNATDSAKQSGAGESGENTRDFTIETDKGPMKATMGWRFKVGGLAGGDGASDAADRAEVKREETAKPAREPLVDVFVEDDHVLVTAELPGVSSKDVSLTREGTSLVIETTGASRFRAVIDLPATVPQDEAPTKALRNGILELRFKTKG
jgi:HSP20 family molecular chaperone IbpA